MMENAVLRSAVPLPPPRLSMPRNFSCVAELQGSLAEAYRKADGDSEREGAASPSSENTRGRVSSLAPQSPTSRRRAKSQPAPSDRLKLGVTRVEESPARRKKVRFADSLGLDLISVRHFCDADAPQVPDRVIASLRGKTPCHLGNLLTLPVQTVFYEPMFANPLHSPHLYERLKHQKVCLETLGTDEFSISGVIRVLNLAYEKQVTVRYTLNGWISFLDIPASYIPNACDGNADKFSFKLITPAFLESGGTLQFAIRYCVSGGEYWDNNEGNNYSVRSHKFKISPPKEWENAWIHFI
nr:PREDICTED: protein phosphatase 1 regulatory subunit 3E-like [Latimeria chalumnae]|eukprot:XP_014349298.1 PREDICTED: protein phosphatase 1 regulatory subunit 3E-like [Latimeria chalumnae]